MKTGAVTYMTAFILSTWDRHSGESYALARIVPSDRALSVRFGFGRLLEDRFLSFPQQVWVHPLPPSGDLILTDTEGKLGWTWRLRAYWSWFLKQSLISESDFERLHLKPIEQPVGGTLELDMEPYRLLGELPPVYWSDDRLAEWNGTEVKP